MKSIYLIGSDAEAMKGLYKIGVTCEDEEKKRLMALQQGCPFELRYFILRQVNAAFSIEKVLHKTLAPYRKQSEWFALEMDLFAQVDGLIRAHANLHRCVLVDSKQLLDFQRVIR
jgi:hypothetical protein